MIRLAAIFAFAVLSTALGQLDGAPHEDDAIPRETVMRLLGLPRDAPADGAQLLVGALPEGLPVTLPVPEGADIIASIVRGADSIHIIMDVDEPAEAVEAFFAAALQEPEWTRPANQGWHYDIFVPADVGGPASFYCHGASDYYLMVNLNLDLRTLTRLDTAPDLTEVRLDLMRPLDYSPCSEPEQPEVMHWSAEDAFPSLRLVAPEGSEQRGGGRGMFDRSLIASVQIMSPIEPQELRDHYGTQMQEQEWAATGSGEAAGFAWSAYDFAGGEEEAWRALLVAMPGSEEGEHEVHLIVARR